MEKLLVSIILFTQSCVRFQHPPTQLNLSDGIIMYYKKPTQDAKSYFRYVITELQITQVEYPNNHGYNA